MTEQLVTADHLVRAWAVAHRTYALDGAMWTLSAASRGGLVWLAIGAGLTVFRLRPWHEFGRLALAVVLATLVADYGLKPAIQRERPFVGTPEVRVIGGLPSGASFPSGHAANAFAGAFVLARLAPGGRVVWWLLAAAVAYSRVYLGVHYPLDVIAGGLVGLACAALAVRVTRSANARLKPPG